MQKCSERMKFALDSLDKNDSYFSIDTSTYIGRVDYAGCSSRDAYTMLQRKQDTHVTYLDRFTICNVKHVNLGYSVAYTDNP